MKKLALIRLSLHCFFLGHLSAEEEVNPGWPLLGGGTLRLKFRHYGCKTCGKVYWQEQIK